MADKKQILADLIQGMLREAADSGKKSYEPDPKPVAKPKKGKRK